MPALPQPAFSSRGQHRLANASPLMSMLCSIFANQYTTASPSGPVSLGVAENSLMHEDLLQLFSKTFRLEPADLTYGTRLKGSQRLFNAIQQLYTQHFSPCQPVKIAHLVTGAGVGSLMDQLIAMLCDEGEGVLLQAPYYSGFDKDLGARNGVKVVPVDCSMYEDQSDVATLDAFQQALDSEQVHKPRALILCNPHNPLGFCYKRETIIAYCKFAERNNLHLIVDEIYALSVFDTSDSAAATPFTSILSVDLEKEAGCNPNRVHHLYGASKDFCMNGLRIGVLHTRNQQLCDSFNAPALFIKVGSPSDALFSSLVTNKADLAWFLSTNKQRLSKAYSFATDWLRANGISFRPSNAGHFIWIDLRRWLPTKDPKSGQLLPNAKEQEAALFLHLLESGVYVAPGAFYHAQESGYFRLTFTVVEEVMSVGLQRLKDALDAPCCTTSKTRKRESINGQDVENLTSAFTTAELAHEIASDVPCHC